MCEILVDTCASCCKAFHKCHSINGMPSDRWRAPLWLAGRGLLLVCHWFRKVALFGGGELSEEIGHLCQKFFWS